LALSELLKKAGDSSFLSNHGGRCADVERQIGAARYERSDEGATWRNGFRASVLDTRRGSLQLRISKLRQGSYFPPFLEARKVSKKALIWVIH
jgi:transposase-like protein